MLSPQEMGSGNPLGSSKKGPKEPQQGKEGIMAAAGRSAWTAPKAFSSAGTRRGESRAPESCGNAEVPLWERGDWHQLAQGNPNRLFLDYWLLTNL